MKFSDDRRVTCIQFPKGLLNRARKRQRILCEQLDNIITYPGWPQIQVEQCPRRLRRVSLSFLPVKALLFKLVYGHWYYWNRLYGDLLLSLRVSAANTTEVVA